MGSSSLLFSVKVIKSYFHSDDILPQDGPLLDKNVFGENSRLCISVTRCDNNTNVLIDRFTDRSILMDSYKDGGWSNICRPVTTQHTSTSQCRHSVAEQTLVLCRMRPCSTGPCRLANQKFQALQIMSLNLILKSLMLSIFRLYDQILINVKNMLLWPCPRRLRNMLERENRIGDLPYSVGEMGKLFGRITISVQIKHTGAHIESPSTSFGDWSAGGGGGDNGRRPHTFQPSTIESKNIVNAYANNGSRPKRHPTKPTTNGWIARRSCSINWRPT
ncbi:unnamed protein product [Sphagnum balticum]